VLIRLRSESNGCSSIRGERILSSATSMPAWWATCSSAVSVGSPSRCTSPSSVTSIVPSLQSAPAASATATAGSSARVRRRRHRPAARRQTPTGDVDDGDGHHVLGERAGLVGADDRDRPQGLDRRQLADQRVASQHPLRADRQGERHHGGQALRDHGDRHADGCQDEGRCRLARDRSHHDDEAGDHQTGDRQLLADPIEPDLERCVLGDDRLEHRGDLSELGRHAGPDDDARPAAVRDLGARVRHAAPVTQREVLPVDRIGLLVDRLGLTGERRLLDPEVRGLDQPEIGGHHAAGLDHHDVARHQLDRRDLGRPTVPDDAHDRHRESTQRGDRPFGPVLLQKAERREQHDDRSDRPGLEELAEHQRQQRSADEDQHHHRRDLLPDDAQRMFGAPVLELVGTEPLQPVGGFDTRQPVGRRVQPCERVERGDPMPLVGGDGGFGGR
jgi:hypothetical protein